MSFSPNILNRINELTLVIETNYPELYQFLEEEPITIPSYKHPRIDDEILNEYLENLKRLIQNYEENQ